MSGIDETMAEDERDSGQPHGALSLPDVELWRQEQQIRREAEYRVAQQNRVRR